MWRIEPAADVVLVARHGGDVELWDVASAPRLARTLEGVHTPAQARALGSAGDVLHTLTVHTHRTPEGLYDWSVHHESGDLDGMAVRELASGAVRAYDVSVDAAGRTSILYQNGGIGGPVFLARDGSPVETIPLPSGVEPYAYDDVAPAFATYSDGAAYVLVRRGLPSGPLGQRFEQLVAARSPSGSWEILPIAEDDPDPCASIAVEEGATCAVDRTTYGPEAAIVAGPLGPAIVLMAHRTVGSQTYSCIAQPGCIPCRWSGALTTTHQLMVLTDREGELAPLEGIDLHDGASIVASAAGTDVHLAVTDHESSACRVRYVRIACE